MAAAPSATTSPKLYRAFVSYSHADRAFGRWLHNRLETYRFPKDKVGAITERGAVAPRLGRLFRDEAEAGAGDNLQELIEKALRSSRDLIVICSPNSARSPWVDKEIRYFKAHNPDGDVFAVILDGQPNTNDPNTECFPDGLKFSVDGELNLLRDKPEEPLAADVVKAGREDAALRLLAGLTGLTYNDLRDREAERVRAQRRRAAITMAAALVLIAFAAIGLTLAGTQTWRNEISRADLLTAEAERALRENDVDKAILLLLAAAPAREGHLGPGLKESPLTEVLLAQAAFEYRLERDVQLAIRDTGFLQYRNGELTALQFDPKDEAGSVHWRSFANSGAARRWSHAPDRQYDKQALGRYGGPLILVTGNAMRLRDPQTGRAGPAIQLPDDENEIFVSANGRYFAIRGGYDRLAVFRANDDLTAEKIFESPLDIDGLDSRIDVTDDGAIALVYDAASWRCIALQDPQRFKEHAFGADVSWRRGALSPLPYAAESGPVFAISNNRNNIELRNCADDEPIHTFDIGSPAFAQELQFSPDGRNMLTAAANGARLYDIAGLADGYALSDNNSLIAEFPPPGPAHAESKFLFSPDSKHLAGLGAHGRLRVWSARNGEFLRPPPNPRSVYRLAPSSDDGVSLVHATEGVWALRRGANARRMTQFPECAIAEPCALRALLPFNGGRQLLIRRNDNWLGLYDSNTGATASIADLPRNAVSMSVADGVVAIFYGDRPISTQRRMALRDSRTGARVGAETSFDFVARALSPDKRFVAGVEEMGSGARLVLADARTGDILATHVIRETRVPEQTFSTTQTPFQFSPDNTQFFGVEAGAPFRMAIRETGGGYRLEPIPEPAYDGEGPLWVINNGAADSGSGRSITRYIQERQQLTPNFPPNLALSRDGRTLFALSEGGYSGRMVRAYDLPPRGQALIDYACARLSPDRASFTDAEMAANPLLRPDDRTPCARAGLLSWRWWKNLVGLR